MCKAMNRSFFNVILGGFGGETAAAATGQSVQRTYRSGSANMTASPMGNADSVIGGFHISKRESPPRFKWSNNEALDSDKSGTISDATYEEKLVSGTRSTLDSSKATLLLSNENGMESFLLSLYGRKNELAWRISTPAGPLLRVFPTNANLESVMAEEETSEADIQKRTLQMGTVICARKEISPDTAANAFDLRLWLGY